MATDENRELSRFQNDESSTERKPSKLVQEVVNDWTRINEDGVMETETETHRREVHFDD